MFFLSLQELLLLLNHIDKDNKGYVSVTEFARGLQAIRNTAKVGTSTPAPPGLMRRYHSEVGSQNIVHELMMSIVTLCSFVSEYMNL